MLCCVACRACARGELDCVKAFGLGVGEGIAGVGRVAGAGERGGVSPPRGSCFGLTGEAVTMGAFWTGVALGLTLTPAVGLGGLTPPARRVGGRDSRGFT